MNVELLARIQFTFTVAFHYLYPPLTIGLSIVLVYFEAMWLKTKRPRYHNMGLFWTRIFGLIFAIGVATGVVMEFEFGTNWATYSRFVGDVFGSALAAEGIFAFFLESGFLAILLFGWDKVKPGTHFFATCMVCLGAHFSSIWVVVANSWMQTPAGYHLEENGKILPKDYNISGSEIHSVRAVIDNFWELLFNPSSMERLSHVIVGAWLTGAFLVISISAYYILKGRHLKFAKSSMRAALVFALVAIILQGITGDSSAVGVGKHQPAKLAAMEGLYKTQAEAPLAIVGWVDNQKRETHSLAIPGLLSFLAKRNFNAEVTGLDAFDPKDWPNVPAVFQFYRIMLYMALMIGIVALGGVILLYKDRLFDVSKKGVRFFLGLMVVSVAFPQIANQAGWFTAEMGRQPWIVYNILRTSEGLSKAVHAHQVWVSLILFTFIYALLFALFIFLLTKKIKKGPSDREEADVLPENWRHLAG